MILGELLKLCPNKDIIPKWSLVNRSVKDIQKFAHKTIFTRTCKFRTRGKVAMKLNLWERYIVNAVVVLLF